MDIHNATNIGDLSGRIENIEPKPVFVGPYSLVYRGVLDGELVAIKVLQPVAGCALHTMRRLQKKKIERERTVWAMLDHPNILPLYGFAEEDARFQPLGALVSPWHRYGSASAFLSEHGASIDNSTRTNLWRGVICGVQYLHEHNPRIVHGDLKPANVLIDNHGVAKICDFGLVAFFLGTGTSGLTTTSPYSGTERYLAPELILSENHVQITTLSDVYALGYIGLEDGRQGLIIREILRHVKPASQPSLLDVSLETIWQLVEHCLCFDPLQRPTVEELSLSTEAFVLTINADAITADHQITVKVNSPKQNQQLDQNQLSVTVDASTAGEKLPLPRSTQDAISPSVHLSDNNDHSISDKDGTEIKELNHVVLSKPLPPLSKNFVLRPQIHNFLTEKLLPLTSQERQPRCVVHGRSGSGKTQLASFWIEAHKKSKKQLEADLVAAVRSIGSQYKDATWKEAVAYLSGTSGWLLFFDGADSSDLHLDDYFPNSVHGAVLLTTQNQDFIGYAPDCHIQAEELAREEALDLLHKAANVSPTFDASSLAIVKELKMFAFTINLAGAYISQGHSLDIYLATVQIHGRKLARESIPKRANYPGLKRIVIDLSFRQLPEKSQNLMKICAFLHRLFIPQLLFERSAASGFRTPVVLESCPPTASDDATISNLKAIFGSEWNENSFQDLINPIVRASLMDTSVDSNNRRSYSFPSLVQAYTIGLFSPVEGEHYLTLARQLLLGTIGPLGGDDSIWYHQIRRHVDCLPDDFMITHTSHALAFLMVYKSVRDQRLSHFLWKYCYHQLLEALGSRHPDTILAQHNFFDQLEGIEKIQREVLIARIDTVGPRHIDTVNAMHDLALTLHYQNQREEAEEMMKQVLALRKELLGLHHPDTMKAMGRLASVFHHCGQLKEAEELKREVLALKKKFLGTRHPDTIKAMSSLATTLLRQDRLKETEKTQQKALMLTKQAFGSIHPLTLNAKDALAKTRRYLLSGRSRDSDAESEEEEDQPTRLETRLGVTRLLKWVKWGRMGTNVVKG
ncbi:hypothetical protein FRC17_009963 [Serendipita sp. 399]|nr:hypothetical protein FRC17_009963 [Serendipita sp. 399]